MIRILDENVPTDSSPSNFPPGWFIGVGEYEGTVRALNRSYGNHHEDYMRLHVSEFLTGDQRFNQMFTRLAQLTRNTFEQESLDLLLVKEKISEEWHAKLSSVLAKYGAERAKKISDDTLDKMRRNWILARGGRFYDKSVCFNIYEATERYHRPLVDFLIKLTDEYPWIKLVYVDDFNDNYILIDTPVKNMIESTSFQTVKHVDDDYFDDDEWK